MVKVYCEICGHNTKESLHNHHIIPKTDTRSTNFPSNLAVLCANCHNEVHSGLKIIEGRFLTTNGYKLFWHYRNNQPLIRDGIILLDDGTAEIRG